MRILYECRTAFRQLRKDVGFSCAAILILGLSTGAMAAMFSLVNTVLLSALPFQQPDRLVSIEFGREHVDRVPTSPMFSYPDFFDFQRQSRSLSGLASFREEIFTLTGVGPSLHLGGQVVSANFFRMLGISRS
jgi:hypothetical protein